MAAVAAWDREHGEADDGTDFARDVLPGLRHVPLRVMAEATGLSEGDCSIVHCGEKVTHRRWWGTAAGLVNEYDEGRRT